MSVSPFLFLSLSLSLSLCPAVSPLFRPASPPLPSLRRGSYLAQNLACEQCIFTRGPFGTHLGFQSTDLEHGVRIWAAIHLGFAGVQDQSMESIYRSALKAGAYTSVPPQPPLLPSLISSLAPSLPSSLPYALPRSLPPLFEFISWEGQLSQLQTYPSVLL